MLAGGSGRKLCRWLVQALVSIALRLDLLHPACLWTVERPPELASLNVVVHRLLACGSAARCGEFRPGLKRPDASRRLVVAWKERHNLGQALEVERLCLTLKPLHKRDECFYTTPTPPRIQVVHHVPQQA